MAFCLQVLQILRIPYTVNSHLLCFHVGLLKSYDIRLAKKKYVLNIVIYLDETTYVISVEF